MSTPSPTAKPTHAHAPGSDQVNGSTHTLFVRNARFWLGISVLTLSWIAPVFIPVVFMLPFSTEVQSVLSGLLLFGLPEVGSLLAVAILGKPTFQYLLGTMKAWFGRDPAPKPVSKARYTFGLVVFASSNLFGVLLYYAPTLFPNLDTHRIAYGLSADGLFVTSLFILGGDFWNKLLALFVHDARAVFQERPAP